MAIITISRGFYSRGREIAGRVAWELGYRCIAREVILDACKEFNIPEIRLKRAIHDAPSILERFTHGREKYIAYFRAALLDRLRTDNVVYHGLAGHFFVEGVEHVLKVRIIADMEDRITLEMKRERVSREEASLTLTHDDEERRKWSLDLYGIDPGDPNLYDLVIHVTEMSVQDAAYIICNFVSLERFRTTPQSRKTIEDLALAAKVKATLVDIRPDVEVFADNGLVRVDVKVPVEEEEYVAKVLKETVQSLPGVKRLDLHVAHRVKWSDGRFFP